MKRLTKTFKDWRSRSTSLMLRLNSTFSTWIAVWRELNLAMTVSTDRNSASLRSRSPPSKNRLRLKKLYSTPLRLISPPSVNNFSKCLVLVTSWEKERLRNSTKSSRTSRMKATWLWNKFKLSPTQLIWTRRTASARRPKRTTRQSSNRKHLQTRWPWTMLPDSYRTSGIGSRPWAKPWWKVKREKEKARRERRRSDLLFLLFSLTRI